MKQLTLIFLVTFFSFIFAMQPVQAAGTYCENFGKCEAAGGCGSGEICIDTLGWGGECQPADGRCDNRDESNEQRCGFTGLFNSSTNEWCGSSGGCAAGYMCDSTAQKCIQTAACDNMKPVYNSQCGHGYSTHNQCGDAGICTYGYRCVSVPESVSPFGFACLDQADNAGLKCPGSPSTNNPVDPNILLCGQTDSTSASTCNCTGVATTPIANPNAGSANEAYCCGWIGTDGKCSGTKPATSTTPADGSTPSDGSIGDPNTVEPPTSTYTIFNGPNSEDFNEINPLKQFGDPAVNDAYFTSPAGIISRILLFAFPLAGLILFAMLVWAGFQILAGSTQGSKSIEAGRQRASTAIVGFMLLFVAYWIMQLIEIIFGIKIL